MTFHNTPFDFSERPVTSPHEDAHVEELRAIYREQRHLETHAEYRARQMKALCLKAYCAALGVAIVMGAALACVFAVGGGA